MPRLASGAPSENFFERAAKEAENSVRARRAAEAAEAKKRAAAAREKLELDRLRSGVTARAAAEFGIPVTGTSWAWGDEAAQPVERVKYRKPTPDEAKEAILEHVRNSPDPFAAAGEWITILTQGLSEIARKHLDDTP